MLKFNIKYLFITSIFVLFSSTIIFAETAFLKDGSLVEGSITNETDVMLTLKLKDGRVRNIKRRDIIRITYVETYKDRVYIKKNDGGYLSGHIVAEDRHSYLLRYDLKKPKETKIYRNEIKKMSREEMLWGDKYLGIGTYYGVPFGGFRDVKNPVFQYAFTLMLSTSHRKPLHLALGYLTTKIQNENDEENEAQTNYIYGETGYNYYVNSRFVIKFFAGLGYSHLRVEDGEKNGVGFHVGLKAPIRFWRGFCIAPFVQYRIMSPYSGNYSIIQFGATLEL